VSNDFLVIDPNSLIQAQQEDLRVRTARAGRSTTRPARFTPQ